MDVQMGGASARDGSGEVSLSIDETNKLRASLGLKPLRLDPQPRDAQKERQAHEDAKRKEQEAKAAELRTKIEAAKEKRIMEARLRAVKTLGEASDEEDGDMLSWVERNRKLEQQRKEAAARKAADDARKKKATANRDSDDEDGPYKAEELEGLKVRHNVGELGDGETVIVTLADKGLLDERGNLRQDEEDELENTLMAEDRKRRKAMKASKKEAKPLWEEDGKVRTLLDKYDDEEEDPILQLGKGGTVESDFVRHQEEIRKKLALGGNAILDNAVTTAPAAASDYYTTAELAAFQKPKKKKKERKIRARSQEPDEANQAGPSTDELIASLEAQAAEGGATDLGRRGDRAEVQEKAAAAARAALEDKRARFDHAVEKANWAAQMLRPQKQPAANSRVAIPGPAVGDDEDSADRELRASLERSRRLAQQKAAAAAAAAKAEGGGDAMDTDDVRASPPPPADSVEEVARQAAQKREQEEGGKVTGTGIGAMFANVAVKAEPKGQVITETMEFVRSIPNPTARAAVAAAKPAAPGGTVSTGGDAPTRDAARGSASPPAHTGSLRRGGSDMDEDTAPAGRPTEQAEAAGAAPAIRTGTWVSAEELERAEAAKAAGPSGRRRKRERSEGPGSREGTPLELADQGITGERVVGRGLASALNLLNDKGAFKDQIEWAGRNNDRSKNSTQGLDDVYTGGRGADRVARSVEAALTVRDELGRVLTPKERFRQMCYQFHGIFPSKNKVDKKARKDAEELAIKKAATSEDPSQELDRLRAVQRATGSAYVVLSGKNAGLPVPGGQGAARLSLKNDDDDDDDDEAGRNTVPAPLAKGSLKAAAAADRGRDGRKTIGNLTPWLGDKKVEQMYGIQKPPRPPPH